MSPFTQNLKNWQRKVKKPLFLLPFVFLVVVLGGYLYWGRNQQSPYEFAIAKRQNVVQVVSLTGEVRPAQNVALAFETNGRVARIYVKEGDNVKFGQPLIGLDNRDLQSQLLQARAALEAEEAKLENLKANSRAKQDLANSYNSILTTIQDAYAKSDDAVRFKTIGMLNGSPANGYQTNFCTKLGGQLADLRQTAEIELNNWKKELDSLGPASSWAELETALSLSQKHLEVVRQFLNLAAAALVDNCVLDQSSLDVYRSNVGTARNNVLGVIDKVEALNQKIASSKVAAENSKEVAAQEAVVQSAQAKVNNYEVQLGKTTLVSPLDGIVTEVKIGIGEIALPNTPVISVISRSKFEIEAKVAEADVAKLKVGNLARVTLDAYGEEVVLEARLVSISPAATLIEGVPTYKSIFQFTSEDSRLKAGFTANIDIETSKRLNVVVIPERAVISKDGEKVARVLDEKGTVREVNVKTGLRGSDGNLEVIEGIREGEKVIVALKKK